MRKPHCRLFGSFLFFGGLDILSEKFFSSRNLALHQVLSVQIATMDAKRQQLGPA